VTSDGQVVGPVPPTRTLGFRWTAADNHFASAADVAADEWHGQREADRDNAEKELRQFVHCLPWDPPEVDFTPLQPEAVLKRAGTCKKGIVPAGAVVITVGIDTGKKVLHWVAIAWTDKGGGYVIDYGTQNTEADKLGIQRGLIEALRKLRGYLDPGWQTADGQKLTASQVWIDAGYHEHTDAVCMFCREANGNRQVGGELWRPSKGFGTNQRRMDNYHAPRRTGNEVRYIGNAYHLVRDARWRMLVAHVNSDHWKGELHDRLALPADADTALQLYEVADAAEHRELAEQLTAERQVTKYAEGRGEVVCWERIRRANHFLDAAYLATAAGNLAVTLAERPKQQSWSGKQPKSGSGWFEQQARNYGREGRPWIPTRD
jgi:phage terminase large subunit GpA-like protein